jgi:hypothetical protein
VTDEGVARGNGALETVGVWDGRPFRLAEHLDRLAAQVAIERDHLHLTSPVVGSNSIRSTRESLN